MKARLVWVLLAAIWGSTWLFIKLGLRDLPPIGFAATRFLLAAAVLWAVVAVRRRPLPRARADWALIAATGVFAFALNYGLVFWAEQHISSGLAALLQATIPAFGLVFAHLHLPGERLTLARLAGVGLGVAGVGVIFSNQLSVSPTPTCW
jgi:drug/metabolite transporter (DMT)-like permease